MGGRTGREREIEFSAVLARVGVFVAAMRGSFSVWLVVCEAQRCLVSGEAR